MGWACWQIGYRFTGMFTLFDSRIHLALQGFLVLNMWNSANRKYNQVRFNHQIKSTVDHARIQSMGSNTTLLGCEGRGLPPPLRVCIHGASGAVCRHEGRHCVCSNANKHVGCVQAGAVSRHPMTARSCKMNMRTVMLSHSVYAPLAEATTGCARDVIHVCKCNEHAERFKKMGQNTVIE